MRLLEAIIDANHRAVAGDPNASLHPAEFADELPLIALTCIDPRLNALFPNVLGIPKEQFIWLRNAGNILTGPLSSTMRSLALACAVKQGEEIAIIGHTDCQICRTTTMVLLEKLQAVGVERHLLPDNLNEFFGMFGSERQNVIKACDIVRHSPLIGPKIPVHGLLVDIATGKLEWLVNGYETFGAATDKFAGAAKVIEQKLGALEDFKFGEMKFPETKIGETVTKAEDWLTKQAGAVEAKFPEIAVGVNVAEQVAEFAGKHWPKPGVATPSLPPKRIPLPPPVKPQPFDRKR